MIKTNGNTAVKVKANGNFILKSLEGTGNGLVLFDNNGKLNPLVFSGDASQVLLGDGTFGSVPAGLWSTGSGGKIYYNGGKVGIGTATPNFKLDVDGDVRITQNLYLQGELVISDKIQTPKQMKAQTVIADSIIMDSTRAIYGLATFQGDVKLANKLSVNGNATINGTTTVNGDLKTMGTMIFSGDKTLSYISGIPGRAPAFVLGAVGTATPIPIVPCITPTLTTFAHTGFFQSLSVPSIGNTMFMGCEGADGIIDVDASIPGNNPRLLINNSCGKDVEVCTGTNGGMITLSGGPNGGNVNICAGTAGYAVLAPGLGTRAGVATTSPLAKFDVQNNDSSIPTMSVSKIDAGGARRIIVEPKLNTGDYNYLTQAGDLGMFWTDGTPETPSPGNGFVIGRWGGTGTQYPFCGMRMTKEGFLGIGTALPNAMVDINNGEYGGGPGVRNPIGLKITSTYSVNPDIAVGVLCQMADDKNKTISTGKTDGTTYTENFSVFADGHVFARDIKVTMQSPFIHPDYVFDKGHKTMTIEELDAFVKQNKHLPNVPSAAEVEKNNGINLGEMSEKQLEKIEELTLYIIDLNKKVNELQSVIQEQNKKIETLDKK
ncbi:MAG: hypothetical protein ACJ77K_11940 [Bacteroidia bacterium]